MVLDAAVPVGEIKLRLDRTLRTQGGVQTRLPLRFALSLVVSGDGMVKVSV